MQARYGRGEYSIDFSPLLLLYTLNYLHVKLLLQRFKLTMTLTTTSPTRFIKKKSEKSEKIDRNRSFTKCYIGIKNELRCISVDGMDGLFASELQNWLKFAILIFAIHVYKCKSVIKFHQ